MPRPDPRVQMFLQASAELFRSRGELAPLSNPSAMTQIPPVIFENAIAFSSEPQSIDTSSVNDIALTEDFAIENEPTNDTSLSRRSAMRRSRVITPNLAALLRAGDPVINVDLVEEEEEEEENDANDILSSPSSTTYSNELPRSSTSSSPTPSPTNNIHSHTLAPIPSHTQVLLRQRSRSPPAPPPHPRSRSRIPPRNSSTADYFLTSSEWREWVKAKPNSVSAKRCRSLLINWEQGVGLRYADLGRGGDRNGNENGITNERNERPTVESSNDRPSRTTTTNLTATTTTNTTNQTEFSLPNITFPQNIINIATGLRNGTISDDVFLHPPSQSLYQSASASASTTNPSSLPQTHVHQRRGERGERRLYPSSSTIRGLTYEEILDEMSRDPWSRDGDGEVNGDADGVGVGEGGDQGEEEEREQEQGEGRGEPMELDDPYNDRED